MEQKIVDVMNWEVFCTDQLIGRINRGLRLIDPLSAFLKKEPKRKLGRRDPFFLINIMKRSSLLHFREKNHSHANVLAKTNQGRNR
jgi:hypothetical protein